MLMFSVPSDAHDVGAMLWHSVGFLTVYGRLSVGIPMPLQQPTTSSTRFIKQRHSLRVAAPIAVPAGRMDRLQTRGAE